MRKEYDDYAWPDYTPTYADTHAKWEGGAHYLNDGDYTIAPDSKSVAFKAPICANIQQLIHQVLSRQERITSAYECGCGAGWNVANILKVFPDIRVDGSDINGAQFEFGRKHFAEHGYVSAPGLHDRLRVIDMSSPDAPSIVGARYDLVFSQAVTMHLSDDRAVQFIKNMMALTTRYIMLCENPAWQDYTTLFHLSGIKNDFKMTLTDGPFAVGLFWFEKFRPTTEAKV